MARGCGCAGSSCACLIVAGPGIDVVGTGNSSAPYAISATLQDATTVVDSSGALDLSSFVATATGEITLNSDVSSVIMPPSALSLDLMIIQGTGAPHTINWTGSGVKWPGGTAPVLSTAAGAIDWLTLVQANGNWYGLKTGSALA